MTGGDKTPLICWDSCIFLAWFKKEQDKPLADIECNIRSVVDRKTNLLVSTVSYAEVLDKAGGSDAGSQFRGFVRRPNIVVANVDPRIGMRAAELRLQVLAALEEGKVSQGIKIPDALIAATAIIYRAAELHTFDPILLEISQWAAVDRLPILRPDASGQLPLFKPHQ